MLLWSKQLHNKRRNEIWQVRLTTVKGKKKNRGKGGKKIPFLLLAALCQTKQCCFRAVLKGGWLTAAASSFLVNRNIVGIAESGDHLHQ